MRFNSSVVVGEIYKMRRLVQVKAYRVTPGPSFRSASVDFEFLSKACQTVNLIVDQTNRLTVNLLPQLNFFAVFYCF